MEYASQKELYISLLPVFKVKKRLLSITKYNIDNKEIWLYLIANKWKDSHNLTIAEVVNDIITIEPEKINNFVGGENEKE